MLTVIKNTLKKKNYSAAQKPGRFHYYVTVIMGVAFLLFLIIFLSSCSSLLVAPETKIDVENTAGGQENTQGDETSQDTMALEEEQKPEIDYQNVTVGAEMEGYIPSFLCTNKNNLVRIEITNTSDFVWSIERPGLVRLGYHYYGQDVDYVDYDRTSRSELPREVNPGETVSVDVLINNIENPGYYIIQIDPVLEGNDIPEDNFWFSSKGVEMIEGLCYFGPCGTQQQ